MTVKHALTHSTMPHGVARRVEKMGCRYLAPEAISAVSAPRVDLRVPQGSIGGMMELTSSAHPDG